MNERFEAEFPLVRNRGGIIETYSGYDRAEILTFIDKEISLALAEREREVRDKIYTIKQWIFTAPYGLESKDGKIIPRERVDGEYVKVSDLKALFDNQST